MRDGILAVSNATTTTGAIARLNFQLGELYAQAVKDCCRDARVSLQSVELIGCHGQTIYHEGRAATMQIGEAGGDRGAHRHPGGLGFPHARHRRGRRRARRWCPTSITCSTATRGAAASR